jgi:hypothetical protein
VDLKVTTVIKTFAPFSFVTPPKTPPHKSLSKKNFTKELKGKKLLGNREQKFALLSSQKSLHLKGKQKQKPQKNKKLAAD